MSLIMISLIVSVSAQTFSTSQNDVRFIKDAAPIGVISVYSENTFGKSKTWGYNIFATVTTTGWGEIYPGIWCKPWSKTFVGVSGGVETGGSHFRGATSFIKFADTSRGFFKRLLIKGFYEQGAGNGNYWWHASIQYQTKHWKLGVMSRRFYGNGPIVQCQHKKVSVGGAYLYDAEAKAVKPTLFIGWDL